MATKTTEPRFPKAKVKLIGEDGNAFLIIGRTIRALRAAGATEADIQEFTTEATSGDYDNVLATVIRWVGEVR